MPEHLDVDLELDLKSMIPPNLESQISQSQRPTNTYTQTQTQQSHAQKLREDAVRRGENAVKGPRLERSPHPYHKRHEEIPFDSERSERVPFIGKGNSFVGHDSRMKPSLGISASPSPLRSAQNTDEESYNGVRIVVDGSLGGYVESTNSDSGTEADDEHFLKGLPAPRIKPHKGLRGENGGISSTPSPLLSPAIMDDELQWKDIGRYRSTALASKKLTEEEQRIIIRKFRQRRRIEVIRRTTEAFLLCFVGGIIYSSEGVKEILYLWKNGMLLLQVFHEPY